MNEWHNLFTLFQNMLQEIVYKLEENEEDNSALLKYFLKSNRRTNEF